MPDKKIKNEFNEVKQAGEEIKKQVEEEVLKGDPNILAAISYLWILFLIPLFLKKDSEFIKYHAKQGLVLFVFSLIVTVLGSIPVIGWLIIMPFGWLAFFVLMLLGILNALRGNLWEMPYLGKFAKKINF